MYTSRNSIVYEGEMVPIDTCTPDLNGNALANKIAVALNAYSSLATIKSNLEDAAKLLKSESAKYNQARNHARKKVADALSLISETLA